MFRTLSTSIKPIGARATPKAARAMPSTDLIMSTAFLTPAAIDAAAASAALPLAPPVAKAEPPLTTAPPTPRAALATATRETAS